MIIVWGCLTIYFFSTNPILEVISQRIYNTQSQSKPFFISGWDLELQESEKIQQILNSSFNKGEQDAYRYLPADENYNDLKNKIILNAPSKIEKENIAICTSGTNAIFTCLTILSKRVKKFLLFSPIYFLFSDILKFHGCDIEYCSYEILIALQFDKLEDIVIKNNINVIVLTDPIFAIGYAVPNCIIKHISAICAKYNIWLIIDSLYGGCEWDKSPLSLLPVETIDLIKPHDKFICVDSLTKRLGINGNKFALVFAKSDFINSFQNFQLYSYGGFVISQLTLLNELYSVDNREYIINKLNMLIEKSSDTYKIIQSFLLNSKIKILPANAGYFACLSIPKNLIGATNDTQAFEILLERYNIATLPLSLYNFSDASNYICRINLLLEKQKLLSYVSKMCHSI